MRRRKWTCLRPPTNSQMALSSAVPRTHCNWCEEDATFVRTYDHWKVIKWCFHRGSSELVATDEDTSCITFLLTCREENIYIKTRRSMESEMIHTSPCNLIDVRVIRTLRQALLATRSTFYMHDISEVGPTFNFRLLVVILLTGFYLGLIEDITKGGPEY
jgi:hypothetical protein